MSLSLPVVGPAGNNLPPADVEIEEQLYRICASPAFDAPDRARKFLAYVTEETLLGRADRIKAYSIATEVFGRDASFDAQNDPVVRIEAGRVRRALERYYLLAGQNDPILISIPKGGYVPVFTRCEESAHRHLETHPSDRTHTRRLTRLGAGTLGIVIVAGLVAVGSRQRIPEHPTRADLARSLPNTPEVVVLPVEDLTGRKDATMIARGLTDEVVGRLARFREVSVAADAPDPAPSAMGQGDRLPRFTLEGRLRVENETLRFSSRLVRFGEGSVVWTGTYDVNLADTDLLKAETDIARAIARALAQPYGIIFQTDAADMLQQQPKDWKAYACSLSYYGYKASGQSLDNVQACLKAMVEHYPTYSTGWALLALTYVDELRFRYREKLPAPPHLQLALSAAKRAVELDPRNVRALQADMLAQYFRGEIDEALDIGQRAYELNPDDAEFIAEYGFRQALSGRWTKGCAMMEEAIGSSPNPSAMFGTARAMCSYFKGDYAAAEQRIREANLDFSPIARLILIAIMGQQGNTDEARRHYDWLMKNAPDFMQHYGSEMAMRIRRDRDLNLFFEGLQKAGVGLLPCRAPLRGRCGSSRLG